MQGSLKILYARRMKSHLQQQAQPAFDISITRLSMWSEEKEKLLNFEITIPIFVGSVLMREGAGVKLWQLFFQNQ